MNNSLIKILIVAILGASVISCKRDEAIINAKWGHAAITAFTADSLLFSVTLNNTPLVDSLVSPIGSALKQFPFFDTVAHVQVREKNNWNRIVIDTNIHVHVGFNYIPIVQFKTGEMPVIPSAPHEPPPPAGYCKARIVYTAPPGTLFADSVKCELLIDTSAAGNGTALYTADTFVLSKYEFSERYYVVKKSATSFRVRVYNAVTNVFIRQTAFENTSEYTDFNTTNLKAVNNTGATIYNLERAF